MRPVGIGIVVGIGSAFLATRLLRSLVFGISTNDPVTFTVVGLVLASAALLACLWPARRATQVDPVAVLHDE
jgi:putative ABC transport system permease protein